MQTETTPQEAFCRLYAETWADVLRYLRRRCGVEAAEDLANDVYVIAWRRWSDVPPQRELPWLYGVARNLVHEWSRGQVRDGVLLGESTLEPLVGRDLAEGVVSADAVRQVLDGLNLKDREILLLWAWEGLAAADLARVLGCSAATATVRLHRARRRFVVKYSVQGHEPTSDMPVQIGLRKAVNDR